MSPAGKKSPQKATQQPPWAPKIRARLGKNGLNWSVAKLAGELGYADDQAFIDRLHKIVQGKVQNPRGSLLSDIATALGTSERELRYGPDDDVRSEDVAATLDETPKPFALRVVGYVGANGTTGFYQLAHDRYELIPRSPMDPEKAVALEILGTSAGPWFDGGYAIYNDVRSEVTPDMIGKPCVVWLQDGRVLLKEIRRNGKFFDLYSNDPSEPPIPRVQIKSAARVLRIIHK